MKLLRGLRERLNRRKSKSKHANPSVDDYQNKDALLLAMTNKLPNSPRCSSALSDASSEHTAATGDSGGGLEDFTPVEWKLPLVDEANSEPQNMEEEVKRLQTLQSYFLLDSEGEDDFDRITRLAAKVFDVPICLVSLIDLGRQWFLSRVGLDATETPRKHAFCAHTILNNYKILIIPDATKDDRFKDNPLVTDAIKIRFYGGAALVSPEGYKLGTLCIISPEVRPGGLSPVEQEMLHEMAGIVVNTMVARRNRLLKEEYEGRLHELAKTLYDTKLNMQDAKAMIEGVTDVSRCSMDIDDVLDLRATAQNLGTQLELCSATIRNVIQDTPAPKKYSDDAFSAAYDRIVNPTADMQKLFDNINGVVANVPLKYTVTVELDKSVPKLIVMEDLLLFRAALNVVLHCMGPMEGVTSMQIRKLSKSNDLLVQCAKGGPLVPASKIKTLFTHTDSLLAPVVSIVKTLGGRWGMRDGKWEDSDTIQSIVWFQVPFSLHEDVVPAANRFTSSHRKVHDVDVGKTIENPKNVELDPFQAALLEAGCARRRL
jgi:hypothetical protein